MLYCKSICFLPFFRLVGCIQCIKFCFHWPKCRSSIYSKYQTSFMSVSSAERVALYFLQSFSQGSQILLATQLNVESDILDPFAKGHFQLQSVSCIHMDDLGKGFLTFRKSGTIPNFANEKEPKRNFLFSSMKPNFWNYKISFNHGRV